MVKISNYFFRRWNNVLVGTNNANSRDKWVENILSGLPSGKKILDAGAGECQYKQYCDHLQYVSQDLSQYDGSGNNSGLQMEKWDTSSIDIVSDIVNIPVSDGEFDVVLCTEVLEHLPDPVLAIREFSRILKEGGVLIITAPFVSFTHFAPYHYCTGFNKYFYMHHLQNTGFENILVTENGNYFEYVAQEIRRIGEVSERYCGRSVGFFFRALIKLVLIALDKMSTTDQGSKELANFGLHVIAKKISVGSI